MRYYFIAAMFLLLILVGCSTVKKSTDFYNACKNDEACFAQMVANGNTAVDIVHKVSNPVYSSLTDCIAFNIVSLLSGVLLGKKILKKKG